MCVGCALYQCDTRVTASLHNMLKHNNFPFHMTFITVPRLEKTLETKWWYSFTDRIGLQHNTSYAGDCRPCSQPCNAASPTGKGFSRSLSLSNLFVVLALLCFSVIIISRRSNGVCENSAASAYTANVYQYSSYLYLGTFVNPNIYLNAIGSEVRT